MDKTQLKILKLEVENCRASVRVQEEKYKAAKGTDDEATRLKALKAAETRLDTALQNLEDFKKENKGSFKETASKATEKVKSSGRRVLGWTSIAVAGVATGIVGALLYDRYKKNDESDEATDTV